MKADSIKDKRENSNDNDDEEDKKASDNEQVSIYSSGQQIKQL